MGPQVSTESRVGKLRELARRVWAEMFNDDLTGLSAEMSYYFVLSVFPFLIFLAALVGTLPFTNAWGAVLKWIMVYFPRQAQNMVFQTVVSLTQNRVRFLPIGLVGTLWAASNGIMTMMQALNTVYEVKETRGYIKRLALACVLVVVLALLLLATFALLTAGDWLDNWVAAGSRGLVNVLPLIKATSWIGAVMLLTAAVAVLDRVLPNVRRPWRRILPGVAFMVVGWAVASGGFNLYVKYFSSFNKTYGVLGVFILLMIWMYIVSLVTLVGAEINSELAKMDSGTVTTRRPATA